MLDILTGKTQTLSKGELKVEQLHAGMSMHRPDQLEMSLQLQNQITTAIILNSDVQLEIQDDSQQYFVNGSPVEVGLLNFLTSLNISVQD